AANGTTPVATYNVLLSSNGTTVKVPSVTGRKIVYSLKAYVGVVVDKNGNIVTTEKDTNGVEVPAAQQVTTTTYTVTRNA
ncbi:MAG: hypothetical protein IJ226_01785, partial [Clostridia bacterium]|nr:hypothetical protein [Clostridia bacterium]